MTSRRFAAVIQRNGSYLACQRRLYERHETPWGFPGGYFEGDETWLRAARREVARALDVRVTAVGSPIFVAVDPESNLVVEYVPVSIGSEPESRKNREFRWLTLPALAAIFSMPTDRLCVEFLRTCEAHGTAHGPEQGPQAELSPLLLTQRPPLSNDGPLGAIQNTVNALQDTFRAVLRRATSTG